MALQSASLIFSKGVPKSIGGITIDAYIQEGHRKVANVTNYPIEDGSFIADHVIQRPDVVNIQGLVSKSILGSSAASNSRILDTYETLVFLKELGLPITVVTGLKVYEDMVITNLDINRTARNGQSLPFRMTVQKITIVQSQTAQIPKSQLTGDTATQQQSQQEQDVGDTSSGQTQVTETDNFVEQTQADLDAIFGAFGL